MDTIFLYRCIHKRPDLIEKWDQLTRMLEPCISEVSEVSYLSMHPNDKFWRKRVTRFPEVVDFLTMNEYVRNQFKDFGISLFRDFCLSNKVIPLLLKESMNWNSYGSIVHWLATAKPEDREFLSNLCRGCIELLETTKQPTFWNRDYGRVERILNSKTCVRPKN